MAKFDMTSFVLGIVSTKLIMWLTIIAVILATKGCDQFQPFPVPA